MDLLSRILVISDDEEDFLSFQKLFVKDYQIVRAINELNATEILSREQIAVKAVILDMKAAQANDNSLIRWIKSNTFLHEIPIFAITTDGDVDKEGAILDLGISDFLRKPFNPQVAKRRIDGIVKRHIVYTNRIRYLQRQTATFIMEYDYKLDLIYTDSIYRDFVDFDLENVDIKSLDWIDEVVYRPDAHEMRAFFNLSDAKKTLSRSLDARMLAASGRYEWFRLYITCYIDEGVKQRLEITVKNVNDEMTAFRELEFLAKSDQLTRIPNKETFFIKTRALLDENPNTEYVVIRMDIERFRLINQLYGSVEGDNLLKYVAVKIMECVESADGGGAYCRLESDTYGICVPNDAEYIEELERYIQDALSIYPIKFDIKVSFGHYVVDDRSSSINTMLDRAFAAQKLIKGSYVRRSAYYDFKLRAQEQKEHRIITEMRDALDDEQFAVYLQPKCDMNSGKIVGSEALVRWIHPKFGMISPGEFIPVFEKNGFITEIDRYVLKCCCKLIKNWIERGLVVHPISVNISRTDLYNPKLFSTILETVDEYAIPHSFIEFELTESSFILDSAPLTGLVSDLRAHNFKVLMDDFGSGYSSLNSLRELQVDVLKIDIKFLPASAEDTRARAILSTVVNMAKKLGLSIVVEGVEKEDQLEFLKLIGCTVSQGFYFYRPMPIQDYENALELENSILG